MQRLSTLGGRAVTHHSSCFLASYMFLKILYSHVHTVWRVLTCSTCIFVQILTREGSSSRESATVGNLAALRGSTQDYFDRLSACDLAVVVSVFGALRGFARSVLVSMPGGGALDL